MQGLGNDFVLLDARHPLRSRMPDALSSQALPNILPNATAITRTAARRYGIGYDQLLVMTKPTHAQEVCNLTIFNPDASEAQACGNGTRCVARYIFDHDKNLHGQRTLALRVAGQRLSVERISQRTFAVEMGVPKFSAKALGLTKACPTERLPLGFEPAHYAKPFGVSMSNPHAVFFTTKSDAQIKRDLSQHGARLSKHPLFGEGANISFARIEGRKCVKLFVWERGAGNTHACGSAACATLVAGIRRGELEADARVCLEGGDLLLSWRNEKSPVVMTGPADYAFFGTTHLFS